MAARPPEFEVPSSSERSSVRFFAHMPRSWFDPGGTFSARHGALSGAGFSVLLLDLLPHPYTYETVSTFRRVRAALWPTGFPVYASSKLFRHPFPFSAPGFSLVLRWLPHGFMA